MKYVDVLKKRRSIRRLNKDIGITEVELIKMIEDNLELSPSSYNSQSPKVLLLLGEEHHKYWDIVLEQIKKVVDKSQFTRSEKKLEGFRNGFGTILFFDDLTITEDLIEKYPLYKDSTEVYSEHNNAILQVNLWNSFASVGIGASLQHYNALVKDELKAAFGVPDICRLIAQMPFGGINEEIKPKKSQDSKDRLLIMR